MTKRLWRWAIGKPEKLSLSSFGHLIFMVVAVLILPRFISSASATAIVRSVGGNTTPASIQPTVDTFRADLGGANNGVGGSFATGRREINWDGVPDDQSAPANLPADFFNTTSPRGAVFATALGGTGFQVSMDDNSPADTDPDQVRFDNLNMTYSSIFSTFSAERLFTPLSSGDNGFGGSVMDVLFFVPGTTTPATVSGFGAVFTDVDVEGQTIIFYFDANDDFLDSGIVPAGTVSSGSLSFLGVSFTTERIGRVRIQTSLTAIAGDTDDATHDAVVMDDFIYGEPLSAAAVGAAVPMFSSTALIALALILPVLGWTVLGRRRERRTR